MQMYRNTEIPELNTDDDGCIAIDRQPAGGRAPPASRSPMTIRSASWGRTIVATAPFAGSTTCGADRTRTTGSRALLRPDQASPLFAKGVLNHVPCTVGVLRVQGESASVGRLTRVPFGKISEEKGRTPNRGSPATPLGSSGHRKGSVSVAAQSGPVPGGDHEHPLRELSAFAGTIEGMRDIVHVIR